MMSLIATASTTQNKANCRNYVSHHVLISAEYLLSITAWLHIAQSVAFICSLVTLVKASFQFKNRSLIKVSIVYTHGRHERHPWTQAVFMVRASHFSKTTKNSSSARNGYPVTRFRNRTSTQFQRYPKAKRLEVLGIDSLEIRRLRYDLVFVYKMLFGLADLKFSDYFVLRTSSTTRGHDYKLFFLAYSRLNVRKHFFSERVVPVWNNLESNVINFSNINRFKSSLLHCNLSRYTHFWFSLVHVTDCLNVYCLHIEHCIMICVACNWPVLALCFYFK